MSDSQLPVVPRLLFRVGDHAYLLPLEAVAEVTPAEPPRLIPCVPLELGGIVNVRGEPVPVVDGGVVLRGQRTVPHRHAIFLRNDEERLGVLVSSVSRIERRCPVRDEAASEEAAPSPFVARTRLGELKVGVIDVAGLVERMQELLGGASPRSGGGTCQSAF